MASTAKLIKDDDNDQEIYLNHKDYNDKSELSEICNTFENQLSENNKDLLNNNQNNIIIKNNNHNFINNNISTGNHENVTNTTTTSSTGTSVAIGNDLLTSNGYQHQQQNYNNQSFSSNNNITGFINNNLNDKNEHTSNNNNNKIIVTDYQQVVNSNSVGNKNLALLSSSSSSSLNNPHQEQQQHQQPKGHHINYSYQQNFQQQLQNMPKSNEPIKIVYPGNTTQQQQQSQQQHHPHHHHHLHHIPHHQQLSSQSQNSTTIVTMNSSQQTTGNRVTFTSQTLPNGTINITSQPQQIVHAVSASGLPTATTIKTITSSGLHGATGQQTQQNQTNPGTTQTLVIKNQSVSLPAGLVSSAPGMVTMTKTINQGNQQNLVGAQPNLLHIVGVRPPAQNQQKNVTTPLPRVVIGGPMVGTRPTSPAITLSTIQSGQSGPALILKTENGYQLLRVGPASAAPVAATATAATATQNIQATNSGNQTIRLQTVPAAVSTRFTGPPLALRKTIVTQQQVKQKQNQSIATTSGTNIVVNSVTSSTNATQVLASQAAAALNTTVQPTVASVAPVSASTHQQSHAQQQTQTQQQQTQQQTQTQQTHHVVQQQHQQPQQQQQTQPQLITTSSGTTQTTTQQQQNAAVTQKKNIMQGNTKEKCRKFLANLIELSSREPKQVEKSVRTLIQELVDANVEPEEFCDRLERLLNASPQPCLIGFLKKSLPLLRQSLFTKELVIEGIKPPPQHVIGLIGSTTLTQQLPRIQAQIRPIGQQTTTIGQTQVRMVTQSTPRPIGQTTITKQTAGGVRIQGPIQASSTGTLGPRLMNAQIRPVGVSTATSNLVQSSNIQNPPALQPNFVQIRTASTVNRSPATVQIRATTPVVRATTPLSKNSTIGVTQVKVGQTQIKPVTVQTTNTNNNNSSNVSAAIATVSINNSTLAPLSNSSSTPSTIAPAPLPIPAPPLLIPTSTVTSTSLSTNSSSTTTNKIVTIKAQSAQQSTKKEPKEKQKKDASSTASAFFQQSSISSVSSSVYGDDDINDVAAMGGVNLAEESQKILGSTEMIGTQIRSCKDEVFLHLPALQSKIRQLVAEHGLEEPNQEVAVLISHACQERLKNIVEKLAVIAEHRIDIIKVDPRYEVTKDVRGQIKFLEELDKVEQKRHEEQEREMLLRAAKSRSKIEDPEQAKLKAKAKEMQRAEMEELRQRDANMTALQAIGPRKKPKLDGDATSSSTQPGSSGLGTSGISPAPLRPRIKRVNMRDMLFFMEQEKEFMRSLLLYKAYLK